MTKDEEILAQLIDEIGKKMKKHLSCFGDADDISFRDISIIDFIGYNKKTMGEIAEEMNLTPGTITPAVDKMISNKYLKRERDEEIDRRKVFIFLDKKGLDIYTKHFESKLKVSKAMLKTFKSSDRKEVISIMKQIKDNLDLEVEE